MDIKKTIAQIEHKILGGDKPQVKRFWDECNKKNIDLLYSFDRPQKGVVSYATIGLTDVNIGLYSESLRLSVELVGVCDEKIQDYPNILVSTAFEIIDNQKCNYGCIIPNIIEQYIQGIDMKNIYLMNPFLWEDLNTVEFEDRKVTWLLAVPISDNELQYAMENGTDALEDKFEEMDIDIFDISRKSIL